MRGTIDARRLTVTQEEPGMATTQPPIPATGRVLGAVDPSPYANAVTEYAAWAASRLDAPLELLHTLERVLTPVALDFSGNLALVSQEALLAELTAVDEQRATLAQEQGRILLEQAREHATRRHGVAATTRQCHGLLVEALLDVEDDVRLFVLGKRGANADSERDELGSQVERVVRAVHRPVLVVPPDYRPVTRFLIAFDGSATSRRCVDLVSASPLLRDLACEVLLVGTVDAAISAHVDAALDQLRAAGFDPRPNLLPGSPETVIAQQVRDHGIDLLVMGAYGHSRIRNLIVGSTTTQLLRSCQVPVLLLR
ncbi:universal stress protein [Montanilutibacter psychrotolerans]|nr:universal stress protein [Lysobacter psychrotolerans]